MKKIIPLLFFLLLVCGLPAANINVRDLSTTTVLPAANDYLLVDGVTNGTSKSLGTYLLRMTATRATLAALDITNAGTGQAVTVLGATAAGDGGGALYTYDSSSSATPDGINVIAPGSGSGRWLICRSFAIPAPTLTTFGGVFSTTAVAHQYLTAINTDGTVSQAAVTTADISGFGSMATQSSAAISVSGGNIDGTSIGVSAPATGRFSALRTDGNFQLSSRQVTATSSLLSTDSFVFLATSASGPVPFMLTSPAGLAGIMIRFKNASTTGAFLIESSSALLWTGSAQTVITLASGQSLTVVSDGTYWQVLN